MKHKLIAVASDHAGFELKQHIIGYLEEKGYPYKDFGATVKRATIRMQ